MSFGDVRYKRALNTPVLAGQDADGLWFAAAAPLDDLWGHIAPTNPAFSKFLDAIPFVEVRTDTVNRRYGGNCCVVDIFSYPAIAFPVDGVGSALVKVRNKIDAVWGGIRRGQDEWTERWRNVPLANLIPEDMTPINHSRFTVDAEGMEFAEDDRLSWARHAASWLRWSVEALYLRDNSSVGTLKFMGTVPFYDVADHFIHIGEQDQWG